MQKLSSLLFTTLISIMALGHESMAQTSVARINNIQRPVDGNDDYTSRAEEVKKHFPGQVLITKDLMEF